MVRYFALISLLRFFVASPMISRALNTAYCFSLLR
jgi:hypothetical protein